jgi:hypothetical protein
MGLTVVGSAVAAEQGNTTYQNVSPRQLYKEPQQPRMMWPPNKPPTLEQMERDMRIWSHMRHEVVELAVYEGQRREHERAKGAYGELMRRYEHAAADAHRLEAELAGSVQQHAKSHAQLALRVAALGKELSDAHAQLEAARSREDALSAQAAATEAQRQAALAQRDASVSAANEERLRSFARQAVRRMLHRELAGSFSEWARLSANTVERRLWKAKEEEHAARARALQGEVEQAKAEEARTAAELHAKAEEAKREAAQVLERASAEQEAMRAVLAQREAAMAEREAAMAQESGSALSRAQAELEALRRSVDDGQQAMRAKEEAHAAELAALREKHAAELAAEREAHEEQAAALRDQVEEQVRASAAQADGLIAAREADLARAAEESQQAKADLMMRAAVRRMQSRDLSLGFNSWAEMWQARVHARARMREIANRLHPETAMLAAAFYFWQEESSEAGRAAALQSLERRQSKMQMMLEIRDKEIARLKVVIAKLLPPEKTGAFAKNKLEKQRRAAERREAASSSPGRGQ